MDWFTYAKFGKSLIIHWVLARTFICSVNKWRIRVLNQTDGCVLLVFGKGLLHAERHSGRRRSSLGDMGLRDARYPLTPLRTASERESWRKVREMSALPIASGITSESRGRGWEPFKVEQPSQRQLGNLGSSAHTKT